MRKLALLLAFVLIPCAVATAQEPEAPEGTVIKSAQVSGVDRDQLSPGLRQAIDALVGEPLNRERLGELVARIEAERPEVVAAVRSVLGPDGQARVTFLVGRIRDDQDAVTNINERYIVESVTIQGVPDSQISQKLRDDLQALVGRRLDRDEARQLDERLGTELPDYDVSRRISRGNEPGHIRLVFEMRKAERARWLHFAPSTSKGLYHSEQGWSGLLDIPIGGRDFRVTPHFAFGNSDDLIEEYTGYGARIEARKIGIERLGLSLDLSHFDQTWEAATLAAVAADPSIPRAYEERTTVAPSIAFALSQHVRVSGGVSVSELEPLSLFSDSQMASAAVAGISYDQRWNRRSNSHQTLWADFALRSGSNTLGSDLVYTRYVGSGRYWYGWGKQHVTAAASVGSITGEAPLFERFSLGDSTTLRGWDSNDIAPAGGERMFHSSVEYALHGFGFFLDTGSVWHRGPADDDARFRFATGLEFQSDGFFMTLGLPLNADHLSATFMIGIRSPLGFQFDRRRNP